MGPDPSRPRRRFAGLGVLPALFWAAAFAAAYSPAPIYYSNQNQYFLHGLAAAGRGDLAHDWLANTRDPTPLFSAAVAWTYTNVGEWAFEAVYYVLLGVYFLSLVALIDATLGLPQSRPMRFLLLTLLVAAHAAVVRLAAVKYTGVDMPRYLHYGVAAQYITGPGLQPSAFGVFLVTSMAAFARGRAWLAAVFAALTCVLHATYLLPAALLTLTYMLVLFRRGRPWAALFLGAGTLAAVAPVVYFGLTQFGPTTPETYAAAQRVLAEVRIPHHAVVAQWWDRIAKLQVLWLVLAIALSVGTRLFPLLAIPALGAVALTLVQLKTGNLALALVFPWRVSAVLVPVATAAVLARLVGALTPWPDQGRWLVRLGAVGSAALLAVMVYGGVVEAPRGTLYEIPADDAAELPLYAFVRDHREPGDLYLIPVAPPAAPPAADGSPSPRLPGTTVPWNLQRFRLLTGAAIYVDVKAIPYKDVELLEWHRRVEQVKRWYAANDWDAVHDELVAAGITHVVVPASEAGPAATLWRVYADPTYCVYRVRR